ncbi:hypothetical protein GALMADRAFT_138560 [Galerina marginata CBS 339.88]|uniref:DUF6532 domain-containing protein n=1 Tax=Galerina marginata (strain CBS 339.88) TaxID=685588 RepID=A0A067T569_GALM3|nr:hypothetical protein GALMADRAFT_138560 [Galerina marginata CBS 339.88]
MPTHASSKSPDSPSSSQFSVQPSECMKSVLIGCLTRFPTFLSQNPLDVEVYMTERSLSLARAKRQRNDAEEALAIKRLHELEIVQEAASVGKEVTSLNPNLAIELARATKETLEAEEALIRHKLFEQKTRLATLEDELEAMHVAKFLTKCNLLPMTDSRRNSRTRPTPSYTYPDNSQQESTPHNQPIGWQRNAALSDIDNPWVEGSNLVLDRGSRLGQPQFTPQPAYLGGPSAGPSFPLESRPISQSTFVPQPAYLGGPSAGPSFPLESRPISHSTFVPQPAYLGGPSAGPSFPLESRPISHSTFVPQPAYPGGPSGGPFYLRGSRSAVNLTTAQLLRAHERHNESGQRAGPQPHTPHSISLDEEISGGNLRRRVLQSLDRRRGRSVGQPSGSERNIGSQRRRSSRKGLNTQIEYGSEDDYDSADGIDDDGAEDGIDIAAMDPPIPKTNEEPLKSIISSAQRIFLARTFQEDLFFPSVHLKSRARGRVRKIADESFAQALADYESKRLMSETDSGIRRLIYSISSQETRYLKDLSSGIVDTQYSLRTPDPILLGLGIKDEAARRLTVASLLLTVEDILKHNLGRVNPMPFTDGVPSHDESQLRFSNEAILAIAAEFMFAKDNAIGRLFHYLFSSTFPTGVIALVITIMYCHIKSWASGTKMKFDFCGDTYRPLLHEIHDGVTQALADPDHGPILRQLYKSWWHKALVMYGVNTRVFQPLTVGMNSSFSKTFGPTAYRTLSPLELAASFSVSESGLLERIGSGSPVPSESPNEFLQGSSTSVPNSDGASTDTRFQFDTLPYLDETILAMMVQFDGEVSGEVSGEASGEASGTGTGSSPWMGSGPW